MSFHAGVLTVHHRDGMILVWKKLPEQTKFLHFDPIAEQFQYVKPGKWISIAVDSGNTMARIGEKDRRIRGSIMSFKDQRLLLMGKDPVAAIIDWSAPPTALRRRHEREN